MRRKSPRGLALTLEPDSIRRSGLSSEDQKLIAKAVACLEAKYLVKQPVLSSSEATRDYLKLRLDGLGYEVFAVLLLDNRHQVLHYVELFRGTIDGASVHPREVVQLALSHHAAAVIFAHNHPSGMTDPSASDRRITQKLKDALALIEVRVLDHIVIGAGKGLSFAEQGLL